jgi:hypothetical protein
VGVASSHDKISRQDAAPTGKKVNFIGRVHV